MSKNILLGLMMLAFTSDSVSQSSFYVDESDYELVFREDFSGRSGSLPDSTVWRCTRRGRSTWDRWTSRSADVVQIRRGRLLCRAMRNRAEPSDTALMLTGAVETQGKFSFQYGKIEVRARTNTHDGNFPAIWLMPQPPAPLHPHGGEIDVFESFGSHQEAHQTVHTNWTLNLKQTKPANTFKNRIDVTKWHVYGLLWTPQYLVFSIDGRRTFVYEKSNDARALANGQWPFDRPFYIILNQSLRQFGTSWGGDPDPNFVYETQFDWVKVYQKKTESVRRR